MRLTVSLRRLLQGVLVCCDFGGFDEFPKFGILLERLILLGLEAGTEKEILERMPIENSMDHQAKLVPFEINAVISNAEAVQYPAGTFQLAEVVHFRTHDLLRQPAKFTQDLQLQLFRHARQFGGAGWVKYDLERSHRDRVVYCEEKLTVLFKGINYIAQSLKPAKAEAPEGRKRNPNAPRRSELPGQSVSFTPLWVSLSTQVWPKISNNLSRRNANMRSTSLRTNSHSISRPPGAA